MRGIYPDPGPSYDAPRWVEYEGVWYAEGDLAAELRYKVEQAIRLSEAAHGAGDRHYVAGRRQRSDQLYNLHLRLERRADEFIRALDDVECP